MRLKACLGKDSSINRCQSFRNFMILADTDVSDLEEKRMTLKQLTEKVSTVDSQENKVHNSLNSDAPKGRTKSGKPRVRNVYEESLQARNLRKKQLKLEKQHVKPSCNAICRKKCTLSFTESDRLCINKYFWDLTYESQGLYIKSRVKKLFCRNRRSQPSQSCRIRNTTYKYFFDKENDQKIEVCKVFFLTTLGFNKKNDQRVYVALNRPMTAQEDQRGKFEHKKIDRKKIKEHIETFRPARARCTQNHNPKRRYLSSNLTTTFMYNNFKEKHPDIKFSYELYRKVLKEDLNISFKQLGSKECEICDNRRSQYHQSSCDESNVQFIPTEKGKYILVLRGYTYSQVGGRFFYCSSKHMGCRARVRMSSGKLVASGDAHNHAPPSHARCGNGAFVQLRPRTPAPTLTPPVMPNPLQALAASLSLQALKFPRIMPKIDLWQRPPLPEDKN